MNDPPLISLRNIRKSYGGHVAVSDVTFDIRRGDLVCTRRPVRLRQDDGAEDPGGPVRRMTGAPSPSRMALSPGAGTSAWCSNSRGC